MINAFGEASEVPAIFPFLPKYPVAKTLKKDNAVEKCAGTGSNHFG
jgi:hypothetical protein